MPARIVGAIASAWRCGTPGEEAKDSPTIRPSVSASSVGQETPKTVQQSRAGETKLVQRRKGTLRCSCWLRRVLARSMAPAAAIVEEPRPLNRLSPRQSERTDTAAPARYNVYIAGRSPAQEYMVQRDGALRMFSHSARCACAVIRSILAVLCPALRPRSHSRAFATFGVAWEPERIKCPTACGCIACWVGCAWCGGGGRCPSGCSALGPLIRQSAFRASREPSRPAPQWQGAPGRGRAGNTGARGL
ncbi:hypothetical protein TraAM80_10426 [Trypanosoma rangeli]|uniref:Uncharacterized protein n=1 Tax=Trypanosoma rangeli TaxID=5698 RepID=A0A422MPB5_TRYRA|nr:uncharacterized protein TraAM80_10426 [Trypanosoma rangeli]RNE95042.1 hypothetical protein TraAM80_10426 [Trypanosoma rangeli]|eukprot:RNE95042.1 hypothetical protein TraAM80_10426 [Trypanosoma rangeli]